MLRDLNSQDHVSEEGGSVAAYGADLDPLQHAILRTVIYRDLFDYPVTAAEIHRYLHDIECRQFDVESALQSGILTAKYLETDGEFYALRGRSPLFDLRRRRAQRAVDLWSRAERHARRLRRIPFVRMVAVTGSLAADNPGRSADIDFMLVTEGGRVWTARAFAKVLQLFDDWFANGELCVNHVISRRALRLEGQSLYTAQELTQMVPLSGSENYDELRAENPWTNEFLPNAQGAPRSDLCCTQRRGVLQRFAEWILGTRAGGLFEGWECRRKLRKYNETAFLLGRATEFGSEATGHRRNVREMIEAGFADRLKGPREFRRNLRVLFGQAYHLRLDPKLWKAMQPFPPLGSLYAAGVARSLGHDVRVHDSMLSVSAAEWAAALQINDPDVVVLFEDNFNYLTKMCLSQMRQAGLDMIAAAKSRGATVLVCSSDSADEPRLYLEAGADIVLVGEGEASLADVLRMIAADGALRPIDIPGIAFMDGGELVQTANRPVIRRIDELPLPAWDLIDLRRYEEIWQRRHGRLAINVVTTRGCPYHCNWCAKPIWGQRYNARSPQSVVDELRWLENLTDLEHVWFMDDIFGLKPGWTGRFADALEQAGIELSFKCLSRPDLLLRKGEVEALARAGCDIVWMGAESGSQKILDAMEKGTRVEMIAEACRALRQHGIRVGLFIQFGYPGETRDDIRATIELIRQVMPEELGISVSYPLPGTKFYERVQAELGDVRHWADSDDLAMLFKGPFNTRFYRALHRWVHSDVMLRRSWPNQPAHFAYALIARTWYSVVMAIAARARHAGLGPLRAELDAKAAATPSRQPGD